MPFKMSRNESECIPYKTEKIVRLRIGDPSAEFNSGCSIVEASFPACSSCKIGFVEFRNNYVASLSLRLKCRQEGGSFVWRTVLKDMSLMPSPHHELGSQDNYVIDAEKQFTDHPENVVAIRLILRQPSPHWLNFGLDNLTFYLPHDRSIRSLSTSEQIPEEKQAVPLEEQIDEISVSRIGDKFKKAICLASDERVRNSLTSSTRFDVDGSYDLNLLSYS